MSELLVTKIVILLVHISVNVVLILLLIAVIKAAKRAFERQTLSWFPPRLYRQEGDQKSYYLGAMLNSVKDGGDMTPWLDVYDKAFERDEQADPPSKNPTRSNNRPHSILNYLSSDRRTLYQKNLSRGFYDTSRKRIGQAYGKSVRGFRKRRK